MSNPENRIFKDRKSKEFVCRQCSAYLDSNELKKGKCPNCHNDEDIFLNEDE